MRIQRLNLKTTILNRPSILVEAKVEAEMVEYKEAVEAKIPTKANRAIKSLMTQTRACKEEVTLVAGGARADSKI